MFQRRHHQRIAGVLGLLDAAKLRAHQCYFGGGTAIALRYGEYRESVDMAVLRDLDRAIERMQARTGWLERCLRAMAMTLPPAQVWQRIRALRKVLPDGQSPAG